MARFRIELAEMDAAKVVGSSVGHVFEVSSDAPAFVGDAQGAALRLNDQFDRDRYLTLEVHGDELRLHCHSAGRGAWVIDTEALEQAPPTCDSFIKGLRLSHLDASVPEPGSDKLWVRGERLVLSLPTSACTRLRHPDSATVSVRHGSVILLPGVQLRVRAHPLAGIGLMRGSAPNPSPGPKPSAGAHLPTLTVHAAPAKQIDTRQTIDHATTLGALVSAIGGALLRRHDGKIICELGSLPDGRWWLPPLLLGEGPRSLDDLVALMLHDRPTDLPVALLTDDRRRASTAAYSFLADPDESGDWILSCPLSDQSRGAAFVADVWRRFCALRGEARSGGRPSLASPTRERSLVPGSLQAFGTVRSRSPKMHELFEMLRGVAESKLRVLLTGENGTGKTFLARAVHDASSRRCRPFVVVNCPSVMQTTAASELFGHERGAFTGADRRKDGFFQAANGGTIFLDEVGELSGDMQAKLLKTVEEERVWRMGSTTPEKVDVRVIAATNRDLEAVASDGAHFRRDLYYRLAVVKVVVPPLRERLEDLDLLVADLLVAKTGTGQVAKVLSPDALEKLRAYDFPGNVRELESLIDVASALCKGDTIHAEDIRLPAAVAPRARAKATEMSAMARQLVESASRTLGDESGTIDCPGGGHDQAAAYRQAVAFILKDWETSGELKQRRDMLALPHVLEKEVSRRLQSPKQRAYEYLRDLYPDLTVERYAEQVARVRTGQPRRG
jgi:transcriptional regulator with AAA-type ATPase domain